MAYKTQVGNVFVNAVKPDTCSYSSKLVKQQQTQLNTIFLMSLLMSGTLSPFSTIGICLQKPLITLLFLWALHGKPI